MNYIFLKSKSNYIYIYIYVYINIYIYIYTYTYIYLYMHTYTYIFIYCNDKIVFYRGRICFIKVAMKRCSHRLYCDINTSETDY